MGESPRQSWVRTAVFLGIGYALVGIVFAVPVTHVQAWRLAAWVVSAIGYAAHIAYERFRLQNSPGSAALHVAFAVALGAFGLAVGANIHSLSAGSTNQHRQAPASLAWDLAGHNGAASVSCRVRHKYSSGACARQRPGPVAMMACTPSGLEGFFEEASKAMCMLQILHSADWGPE